MVKGLPSYAVRNGPTRSIMGIIGSYVMWTLALGDKNLNWK
jgi:hypothetical protein